MHAARVDTNAFFRTKHDGKLKAITNVSEKVLTGQLVVVQAEGVHCRAAAEFRGNVACAARGLF